jgi:hypothetical protein
MHLRAEHALAHQRPMTTSTATMSVITSNNNNNRLMILLSSISGDIWRSIFVSMSPSRVLKLALVCKEWAFVIRDDKLWHLWWLTHTGTLPYCALRVTLLIYVELIAQIK